MKKKLYKSLKVTVAIPAYNAARDIKDAIESVLAQDYPNFELLITDDCSKDNTWQLMQKYKTHPRIRIYRNKKNLGVGATRNKMVRLARGRYISPCDADDIMLPGNLRRLAGFLDAYPQYGVVYGDFLVIDRKNNNALSCSPFIFGRDYNKSWDIIENVVNHAGSMIRKELIKKVGGYDEDVMVDDYSLWIKLAGVTKFRYLENEVYYILRRRPGTLSTHKKKQLKDSRIIIKRAIKRRFKFNFEF